MIQLRELKAKKAKFGFHYGKICLSGVIELGKFLEALDAACAGKYIAEEAGYNQPEMKIYTDDEEVAKWIRLNSKLYQ